MSKIINNFYNVEIPEDKKILVLCDIDDTVLKYDKTLNDFLPFIEKFSVYKAYIERPMAYALYKEYKDNAIPMHTDIDGFNDMIRKINKNNNGSKLEFLTARSKKFDMNTKKQLADIGIYRSEDYTYHYTYDNFKNKASYIENNIDVLDYDVVIFIDDREDELSLCREYFPEIITYQFKI